MNKRKWSFKISRRSIVILILGIVINLAGKTLTNYISVLPFWLDSIGTMYSAALLGPFAGLIVGGVSNCAFIFYDFVNVIYMIISILVGIFVGYFYPRDRRDIFQIVYTATMVCLITIIFCTPINIWIYKGYTGNLWGDALYDRLYNSGTNIYVCSFLGEAFVDFPDKMISMAIATGLLLITEKIPFFSKNRE